MGRGLKASLWEVDRMAEELQVPPALLDPLQMDLAPRSETFPLMGCSRAFCYRELIQHLSTTWR